MKGAAPVLVLAAAFLSLASTTMVITEKDQAKFQMGLRSFAGAMYWKLLQAHKPSENIFFSPASISHTMGMVMSGTRGRTFYEMRRALRLNVNWTNPELDVLYQHIFIDKFEESNSPVVAQMATRAFVGDTSTIFSNYTSKLGENYFAQIEKVDFSKNKATSDKINAWVEDETNGLIKDLVNPSLFNSLTRITLVNTLYFKAGWSKKFKEIGPKEFKTPSGSVIVPFINSQLHCKKKETDHYLYVGVPYKDDETYFVIIMPKSDQAMEDLTEKLAIETYFRNFRRKFESWPSQKLNIHMPEFTFEQDLDVKKVLKAMHVRDLFNANDADLGRMTPERLFISDFLHKARITVNKEGTEAAAASAASATARVLIIPEEVHINRPFIFSIYERGNILFLGRIADPGGK